MNIVSESQTGIWLNTPVIRLETHSENALRFAKNDSDWRFIASDLKPPAQSMRTGVNVLPAKASHLYSRDASTIESHLNQNPCRTLFSHVKFKVVTEIVSNFNFKRQSVDSTFKLTALDIGCSLQMLRCHLKVAIPSARYIGVDCSPTIYPDILCDVRSTDIDQALKPLETDVVVALDLLPSLHHTKTQLRKTLSRWLSATDKKAKLFVFSVPECYKSDDHLLNLNSEQWLSLLNEEFVIEDIQAVGFLSALPYWVGKQFSLKPKGLTQRTLNILKKPLFDSQILKSIEFLLTLILGRATPLRRFSHSIVVTASPRNGQ